MPNISLSRGEREGPAKREGGGTNKKTAEPKAPPLDLVSSPTNYGMGIC